MHAKQIGLIHNIVRMMMMSKIVGAIHFQMPLIRKSHFTEQLFNKNQTGMASLCVLRF